MRHPNPRLYSCEDIDMYTPESSKNEAGCMNVLEEYTFTKIIGYGADGIILGVGHKNVHIDTQDIIVKLLDPYKKKEATDNEIRKSCMVDNMLYKPEATQWKHLYSRTFGWTRCNTVPVAWQTAITEYIAEEAKKKQSLPPVDLKNGAYCMVSDFCGAITLWNYRFNNQYQCRGFLFELIYGLAQAYYAFNFKHNDLHAGNVLVFTAPGRFVTREYTFNGQTYQIKAEYIYPKIIDFGHATFDSDTRYGYEFSGKITGLEKLLESLKGFATPLLKIIQQSDFTTWKEILQCSYFKHLRTNPRSSIEVPIGNTCVVCHDTATHKYEAAHSYKYCGNKRCIQFAGPILHIVKSEL